MNLTDMTFSQVIRAWLIQPMLDQLKQTEANIMADTAKDVDAATASLATAITGLATDFSAAIANLQAAVNAGNVDLTPEVQAILALQTPIQNMDTQAKAILNPPAAS